MKKSKAYAVFFTLLFFGSLGQTLFLFFSVADKAETGNIILLLLTLLFNIILLVFAVRYWRRTFREEK